MRIGIAVLALFAAYPVRCRYNRKKLVAMAKPQRGRLQPSRRAERDFLRRGGATERMSGGSSCRCEGYGVRDDAEGLILRISIAVLALRTAYGGL